MVRQTKSTTVAVLAAASLVLSTLPVPFKHPLASSDAACGVVQALIVCGCCVVGNLCLRAVCVFVSAFLHAGPGMPVAGLKHKED
jgi:hypothetical protein